MDRKRDGPFEIGDRVRTAYGHEGTIIKRDIAHCHSSGGAAPNCLKVDGHTKEYWWSDGGLTLISPTTEPIAAQKETSTMLRAGKAIVWLKDEDHERLNILHQDVEAVMYKTEEQFKLQALSRAKVKAEDYDPDIHDVVLVPFGG